MSAEGLPELFARALELDEAERSRLLAELTTRDGALAEQLGQLLAAAAEASPLDRSPWRAIDRSPTHIGPYRVERELGRGGMGRVYLAAQKTEHFDRRVALKVIDQPRADEHAVRRFRDEVRILASLEHPGIARFLDGGQTADDVWFLALEHVEGEDIVTYAETQGLPVSARVQLFLEVLDAVQYAHERGVVHRDLKPAHLLVGRDGHPRLLDFGISKLVQAERATATVTRTEARALTPAYASPEQFRGEPVTPLSDVYALGAVLYELLAGRRPFVGNDPVTLARDALESDPPAPSTVATRRVDRDLDAICLKALRKEPRERYATVAAFAADLRRQLAGLPVDARRGGRRYRIARFGRRHRGKLGIAAALIVAVAATITAIDAHRAAQRLQPPRPPAPRPFPFSGISSIPIEELENRFAAEPASVEAGAALVLGLAANGHEPEARIVLARVRQIPGKEQDPLVDYAEARLAADTGQPQRALVLLDRARKSALAESRGELLAQVRATRGRLLSTLGQRAEARREMEAARADFERIGDHASLSRVLNDLAIEELERGEFDRGQALLERAVAEGKAGGQTPVMMLSNLALLADQRGRPDLAEPRQREVLAIRRQGGRPERLALALGNLSETLRDLGRPAEADALLDEALAVVRKTGDVWVHSELVYSRGAADLDSARMAGINALTEEIERVASPAGDQPHVVRALILRGRASAIGGDPKRARNVLEDARRLAVDAGQLDFAGDAYLALAAVEWEARGATAALLLLADGAALLPRGGAGTPYEFFSSTLGARMDARAGRPAEARRRLQALGAADQSPSVRRRVEYLWSRAAVAAAENDLETARGQLQQAIAAATTAGFFLDELELRLDLASLQQRAGESAAARQTADQVAARAAQLDLHQLERRARRPL